MAVSGDGGSPPPAPTPVLSAIRPRLKERKRYSEDCIADEDIEGKRLYSVEEKLNDPKFTVHQHFVHEMTGDALTVKHFQEHGFLNPIVIKDKAGLGIRVPSKNFTVNDVRQCVGSRRMLDVMDVNTQKELDMSMKEWVRYYENVDDRDRLLNVISLEFSHTKLENYVEAPSVVRDLDWVECVWPPHLKELQTEATNLIDDMKYPKVQKYCLMSVKGCYTDFHIDFGGTSVWYHILHGRKVFWLIPPTEGNIQRYEQWVKSGKQGEVFFGDIVPECARIQLEEGWTFFIPTGWIHAVFTPVDSLVFGGNFLHSFGMKGQIRISLVEDNTHVPGKFRYPFFTEIMWYAIERYVHILRGRSYLKTKEPGSGSDSALKHKMNGIIPSEHRNGEATHTDDSPGIVTNGIANGMAHPPQFDQAAKLTTHLTRYEVKGLKAVLDWLVDLPMTKKGIPRLIENPHGLLQDLKIMIDLHEQDAPDLAITGKPILQWPPSVKAKMRMKPRVYGPPVGPSKPSKSSQSSSAGDKNSGPRRRRTRCKKCEPCRRTDCGECHFCKDMKKFGGPGRMKQSCISRQCMAPVLPHNSTCIICNRDGWDKSKGSAPPSDGTDEEDTSSLMECSICWDIVHPDCLKQKKPDLDLAEGIVNEDLPNCWECPVCCAEGKTGQTAKSRLPKGGGMRRTSEFGTQHNDNKRLDPSGKTDKGDAAITNGVVKTPKERPAVKRSFFVHEAEVKDVGRISIKRRLSHDSEEEEETEESSGSNNSSGEDSSSPTDGRPALKKDVLLLLATHSRKRDPLANCHPLLNILRPRIKSSRLRKQSYGSARVVFVHSESELRTPSPRAKIRTPLKAKRTPKTLSTPESSSQSLSESKPLDVVISAIKSEPIDYFSPFENDEMQQAVLQAIKSEPIDLIPEPEPEYDYENEFWIPDIKIEPTVEISEFESSSSRLNDQMTSPMKVTPKSTKKIPYKVDRSSLEPPSKISKCYSNSNAVADVLSVKEFVVPDSMNPVVVLQRCDIRNFPQYSISKPNETFKNKMCTPKHKFTANKLKTSISAQKWKTPKIPHRRNSWTGSRTPKSPESARKHELKPPVETPIQMKTEHELLLDEIPLLQDYEIESDLSEVPKHSPRKSPTKQNGNVRIFKLHHPLLSVCLSSAEIVPVLYFESYLKLDFESDASAKE